MFKRLRADRTGEVVNFEGDIAIPGSGWMLLRATNTTPQTLVRDIYPYGTTNPVWIDAGTPVPKASEDANYFVRWIDRVIESASKRDDLQHRRRKGTDAQVPARWARGVRGESACTLRRRDSSGVVLLSCVSLALADKRPLDLADFHRLQDVSEPAFAPRGDAIVYTLTSSNLDSDAQVSDLWRVSWRGGEPLQLTPHTIRERMASAMAQ